MRYTILHDYRVADRNIFVAQCFIKRDIIELMALLTMYPPKKSLHTVTNDKRPSAKKTPPRHTHESGEAMDLL
jgi:hypothetical protein